ncbi:cullin-1 [Trifolium repens]|nr:cullin-1 [Trifolium repens]
MSNKVASFEEGWNIIHQGIKNILEGLPNPRFTSEEYMEIYDTMYAMCYQKPPHSYPHELYEKYKEIFEDYIKSIVLPSLQGKKDELLLRELLERWSNHKTMTRLLSNFFHLLDRHSTELGSSLLLKETGFLFFYSLIDQKREGKPIDDKLFNSVLTFCLELGESTRKDEPKHFAETIIKENAIESTSFGISKLEI